METNTLCVGRGRSPLLATDGRRRGRRHGRPLLERTRGSGYSLRFTEELFRQDSRIAGEYLSGYVNLHFTGEGVR